MYLDTRYFWRFILFFKRIKSILIPQKGLKNWTQTNENKFLLILGKQPDYHDFDTQIIKSFPIHSSGKCMQCKVKKVSYLRCISIILFHSPCVSGFRWHPIDGAMVRFTKKVGGSLGEEYYIILTNAICCTFKQLAAMPLSTKRIQVHCSQIQWKDTKNIYRYVSGRYSIRYSHTLVDIVIATKDINIGSILYSGSGFPKS